MKILSIEKFTFYTLYYHASWKIKTSLKEIIHLQRCKSTALGHDIFQQIIGIQMGTIVSLSLPIFSYNPI